MKDILFIMVLVLFFDILLNGCTTSISETKLDCNVNDFSIVDTSGHLIDVHGMGTHVSFTHSKDCPIESKRND